MNFSAPNKKHPIMCSFQITCSRGYAGRLNSFTHLRALLILHDQEYVGGFVGDAFEHLTPEFQEFVSVHYPGVHTHMLSAVKEAQQQTLTTCSPRDTDPKSVNTRPENSFEDIRAALGHTLVG
jgi:hypothetical protein